MVAFAAFAVLWPLLYSGALCCAVLLCGFAVWCSLLCGFAVWCSLLCSFVMWCSLLCSFAVWCCFASFMLLLPFCGLFHAAFAVLWPLSCCFCHVVASVMLPLLHCGLCCSTLLFGSLCHVAFAMLWPSVMLLLQCCGLLTGLLLGTVSQLFLFGVFYCAVFTVGWSLWESQL